MVNTYLLSDETNDCIIIDAACSDESEEKQLSDFISNNNLKLTRNINTHCHVDHVLGHDFIASHYGIFPEYHEACTPFLYRSGKLPLIMGTGLTGSRHQKDISTREI